MSLWLLGGLVLVDGTLCGFRAAAGRSPRIFLWPYYVSSMLRAAAWAVLTIAVFLGVALLLGDDTWHQLESIAARMIRFYGAYATLVLGALALYAFGHFDISVLATVLILGPFTLVRPIVIIAGAVFAMWSHTDLTALAFTTAASFAMLGFERALELGRPPWTDALP